MFPNRELRSVALQQDHPVLPVPGVGKNKKGCLQADSLLKSFYI
jgi:hypothetical protein